MATATRARPMMPSPFRLIFAGEIRAALAPLGKPFPYSLASPAAAARPSGPSRPRVDPAVEEIDGQIDEGVREGGHEHGRQHHGEVAIEERLHGEPAHARPRE